MPDNVDRHDRLITDFNNWTGYPPGDRTFKGRVLYQMRSIDPNRTHDGSYRFDMSNGLASYGDICEFEPGHVDRSRGPYTGPIG